jgi:hypothetical protein
MNWIAAGEFRKSARRGAVVPQSRTSHSEQVLIDDPDVVRFASQDRWRWSINPSSRAVAADPLRARTGGILVYNTHREW